MSAIGCLNNISSLTDHDATEALISILNTGEGIASILASEETFFNGHVVFGKLILLPDQGTTIGPFGVATPSAGQHLSES